MDVKLKHGSLFSGIGGFDLAAAWMGWHNVFHCEIDPFCRRVLKYHFPKSKDYENIKTTDFTEQKGKVDIITGGFPCQPFSVAGKRLGTKDERHLWPEMLRAIREIRPGWVVAENVRGLLSWNEGMVFEAVCADLEAEGYKVLPFLIPAAGVGAPHRRERIWIVAYAQCYNDFAAEPEGYGKEEAVAGEGRQKDCTSGQPGGTGQNDHAGAKPHECTAPHPDNNGQQEQQKRSAKDRSGTPEPREGIGAGTGRGVISRDITQRIQQLAGGTCSIQGQVPGSEFSAENSKNVDANADLRANQDRRNETGNYRKEDQGWSPGGPEYGYIPDYWKNWPTQPAICTGNDGLPDKLVDITIPKWRTESIKSLGNAIVPQVAFEIFNVIQKYHNMIGNRII